MYNKAKKKFRVWEKLAPSDLNIHLLSLFYVTQTSEKKRTCV